MTRSDVIGSEKFSQKIGDRIGQHDYSANILSFYFLSLSLLTVLKSILLNKFTISKKRMRIVKL